MAFRPLCFVLMPFNVKPDPSGGPDIDFDRIYTSAILPGIVDAQLQPIRADEEELGGIIHRAMFERLLVCTYALADLTTSDANVLYELGVRHAARPGTTLTIHATSTPLPFDVNLLRVVPYELGKDNAFSDAEASRLRTSVRDQLDDLRRANDTGGVRDSPLYQLLPNWNPGPLPDHAAESFRSDARKAEKVKVELDQLMALGRDSSRRPAVRDALLAVRARLMDDSTPETALFVKLLMVHRSISDWSGMLEVCEVMPAELERQAPIRQQRAFAYNRRSEAAMAVENDDAASIDRARAVAILVNLQEAQGLTSETAGLLGRIYKSQWLQARRRGRAREARGFLVQALDAYRRGFLADWKDIYPGINTVTLLEALGGPTARSEQARLLPVVRFAAEQRLRAAKADYWDHATLLEVLVLMQEDDAAEESLDAMLAAHPEDWQTTSTADNLRIIEVIRSERGTDTTRLRDLIERLG